MAKIPITIEIAGTKYPFPEIEAAEEEIYRHAGREVNRLFAQYRHDSLLPKDQLALAALSLAMDNTRLKNSRSLGEDLDRLEELNRRMEEYLAREL